MSSPKDVDTAFYGAEIGTRRSSRRISAGGTISSGRRVFFGRKPIAIAPTKHAATPGARGIVDALCEKAMNASRKTAIEANMCPSISLRELCAGRS